MDSESLSEAQLRALEPTLGSATSPASRRTVRSLAVLPPEIKEHRLAHFTSWDLGNLVRCALAAGAPLNFRFRVDAMPLICFAVIEGAARSLKALLVGGADVSLVDKDGNTALHWAAQKGNTACISLLLDAGAALEAKNRCAARHRPRRLYLTLCRIGRTPLGLAAFVGHSEAVALLLERGANANSKDRAGNTPLANAVACKHIRC